MRIGAATACLAATLWLALGTQGANPALETETTSYVYDFTRYYRPNAEYLGARLAAGELPLWNPHQGAGEPFLASLQPGVLYPANWLHAVAPVQPAFAWISALHIGLAAAFVAALAGALGAGAAGSLLAGLLFATSTKVVGIVWHPPVLQAAAWLPAVLFLTDRTLAVPGLGSSRFSRAGWAVALAAAFGLQLLAGWPYTVAMTALAAGLYGAGVLAARTLRERRLPWESALLAASGVAGGVALAAPQLLPTLELLPLSCRALGSIVEAQAVFVDGPHDPGVFLRQLTASGGNEAIPSIAALVLVAAGLLRPGAGRLRAWLLLGVGVLALAASFPNDLPVYGWLRELPVLGDFRFPFRYRIVTLLCACVLAGVGLGWLESLPWRRPVLRWAGIAGVALLALVPPLLALRDLPHPFPRSEEPRLAEVDRFEALGTLPEADFVRIFWADRVGKLGPAGRLHSVQDLEPFTLRRTAEMLTFFSVGRPLTVVIPEDRGRRGRAGRKRPPVVHPPFAGLVRIPSGPERAAIVDLMSANAVVSKKPIPWLAARFDMLRGDRAEAGERLYANPGALPHAYRVERAEAEPENRRLALERLVARDFDIANQALLHPLPPALTSPRGAAAPGGGAEVELREPERIRVRTWGERPAAVVLTDAEYPGWEATVDGVAAPVLRANTLFRAVEVPAGAHTIELRFRPASFRTGLALAGGAAALGLAALVWARR